MRIIYFYTALIALLIASCNTGSPEFKISGTIQGQNGKMVRLEKFENNQSIAIDSAKIDENGDFTIETVLPKPDFYQITVEGARNFVFIASPDEEIEYATSTTLDKPSKIEGSEDTKLLFEFTTQFNKFLSERERMFTENQAKGLQQAQMMEIFQTYDQQIIDYLHQFIDKNSSSPASLAALSKLNPTQDLEYFKKVRDGIANKMRTSAYFVFLENQIMQTEQQLATMKTQEQQAQSAGSNLAIGSVAPDIALPDPTGKNKSLSELRGKVVLLDFWASWCKPCRVENPNVVQAYKDFKGKGFEVFSVSLDKNAEAWKNAIREDRLQWTHVSDLKFWDSEGAKIYGVQSIPFAVLIDKDGKILAKNLRGPELTAKLKEILG